MVGVPLKQRLAWYRLRAIQTYLDGRFPVAKNFLLTSSPRSGSTLLGAVLNAIPRSCPLFEPLHLRNVPEASAAGFSWRTYRDPEVSWPEGEAFLHSVFAGSTVNDWTSREMAWRDIAFSRRQVVKFVRANRLLPWIVSHFSIPEPLLLMRHPCAVVASQLNYGWSSADAPQRPEFVGEGSAIARVLSELEGVEEFLAASWALDQMPALGVPGVPPWKIVTYEELTLHPEATIAAIAGHWDVPIKLKEALVALDRPSSVVSSGGVSGMAGWKSTLSTEQIDRILRTVRSLGITLYSDEEQADYAQLSSGEIASGLAERGFTMGHPHRPGTGRAVEEA